MENALKASLAIYHYIFNAKAFVLKLICWVYRVVSAATKTSFG